MKVLGWFHNKFKHNNSASLKTSKETRSCFACTGQHEFKKIPADVKLENEDIKHDGLVDEFFLGFLSIGTLGGELIDTEPPTPTFPNISEDSRNEEQKRFENELKLISSKLEEFFEAEQEETANVTSARSSHASVITLSNYQTEETNTEDQRDMATCPLQKCHFGSSLELREAEMPIKKGKNSLGKLFKRNTNHSDLEEIQEQRKKQAKKRDATRFLKKMLKKIPSVSVTTKTPHKDADHGSLLKRTFPKVSKLFDRKVHPEGAMNRKELTESCNKTFEESLSKYGYWGDKCEENTTMPQSANPEKAEMVTNNPGEFSKTITSIPPTANTEHWITTDTEYLVLEL
ncbi:hypothetical protein Leryth_004200 [Lithospermum erythrorhizon]|nr:hypothetical protein Leryth_004200 [Lithospermum erythrorhizon]